MKSSKLLITGVAGFIGSKVAAAALQQGYKVVGVDDLSQGYEHNIPKGCEVHILDLAKEESVAMLPKDIEVILHLAGQSSGEISFDNPVVDLTKNSISTLNLIKFGIKTKVKKIVYASSMSVYGSTHDKAISEDTPCAPLSCYGVGKYASENYLKIYQQQLPYVAFRMFNVYGPGQDLSNLRQGMVSIYLAYMLNKSHVPVKGGLGRFRDFIYIDDVVKIWLQAVENNNVNNQAFNLGTGVRTTVLELLTQLKEIFPETGWTEVANTPGDQFGIYADMTKLKQFFNISEFVSLSQGLKLFSEWALRQSARQTA